jgi:hypothetical protein
MKHVISFIVAVFLLIFAVAPSRAETKSGPIILKQQTVGDSAQPTLTLGHKVKVSCNFGTTDFFGSTVIAAGATIKNTASVPMFYSYHVAFFDEKKNLIGCASQTSMNEGLKPGEETQLGSCLITVPPGALARVKSYQVTWYESAKKIGTK